MKNGIIEITNNMSSFEKMRARKHNRNLAHVEMEKHYIDHPVSDLTSEQEKQAKEYLREKLKEEGITLD